MRITVHTAPKKYKRRLYRCYEGVVLRVGLREFVFQKHA